MPECDLDDNDPLSVYLKRAPMIAAKTNATNTPNSHSSCICCLGVPLHDGKLDSINVRRKQHENINHTEIDKVEDATEVSK